MRELNEVLAHYKRRDGWERSRIESAHIHRGGTVRVREVHQTPLMEDRSETRYGTHQFEVVKEAQVVDHRRGETYKEVWLEEI